MKILRLPKMYPDMTFTAIREAISVSAKEDEIVPDLIEMYIDDYLYYPTMLIWPTMPVNGYTTFGIKIKPYF